MFAQLPLFPNQGSTMAPRVDALFFFLCGICGIVVLGVAILIFYFAIRYRRRSEHDQTPRITGNHRLEWFWMTATFLPFLVMFLWGASVFTSIAEPPEGAMELFV